VNKVRKNIKITLQNTKFLSFVMRSHLWIMQVGQVCVLTLCRITSQTFDAINLIILIIQILFFHKFVLFKHGCHVFETSMKHIQIWCKILMCIKIFHPIYMCFICDQNTKHICLTDTNQLMKKQISHDYYCQIVV
jgi:hypothetical protein